MNDKKNGLTDKEVIESVKKYGTNKLVTKSKSSFFKLLIESLGDPIIKILLIALAIKIVFLIKSFDWYETIGIVIAIFLAITLVVNLFSKKESELISRLILPAITSIVIMMFFAGTKFYLDKTYTKTEFEKIYTEQNANKIDSKKTKVGIGLAGVNIKTEKEYYVDECVKLYNIFKTKSYGTLGLHLLLNLLLIYQIFKVEKIQNKKERLDRDDIILKDEEQNVKY